MHKMRFVPLAVIVLLLSCLGVEAQLKTNTALLQQASVETAQKETVNFQKLLILAKQKNWPLSMRNRTGGRVLLVGVDSRGYPRYITTDDNIISAATIKTNLLWPGGSTGLSLSGSSNSVKSKIAIWDGGKVRTTHVEFTGRVVQKDGATVIDDHATHTSGTLIAAGINPLAKGMSFGAQQLLAYDFNNDVSEMFGASPNLLVSNHSYGAIAGWYYNTTVTPNRWEFEGQQGDTVDYNFGYYDDETQLWDSIAYNAPYYLIVKSAGNNHGDGDAVAVGQPYWRYNANKQMASAGNRPAGISSDDYFDNLPTYSVAKNILTVGAINAIPNGYYQPSDAQIASFSSWGPTDDGRIKPDIVADGVNVLSSYGTADQAYATLSGTSMSSPAVAGSVLLLQEYYAKLHAGTFIRSATLKGLVIHTADEAGAAPGPDYIYGWGLLNMQKAASVITSDTIASKPDQKIYENNLISGNSYTLNVVASGKGPLVATISWTDPKAAVDEVNYKNNPARKLVNDLDLRITSGTATYKPWTLNRATPWVAAATGDDSLNNVEKIVISNPVPGQTYTITITHKGVLQRGAQAYSLLLSGIGGQAYCTSAPTSSAGTRIDSVVFGGIQNANPAGCTTYTDYTGITGQVQPQQTLPVSVKLSSCDASVATKFVKIYIDYNNDGILDPVNELAVTSTAIVGNGTFTGNISIPAGVILNNTLRMRVIAAETTDPTTIVPCGTYGKGETEDYSLLVVTPSTDLALTQIAAPISGDCTDTAQLVVVNIRNQGSDSVTNIPLTAIVKNGGTTIATLNEKYPGTIKSGGTASYTFQQPFSSIANTTYTITTYMTLAIDQVHSNDTVTSTAAIAAKPPTPAGNASVCGNDVTLKVTNPNASSTYFWYNSATSDSAIIASSDTSVTLKTIPANNTFYLGTGAKGSLGIKSKDNFPNGGGYQALGFNFLNYTAQVPVVLKSARFYTGNPGKVTIMVVDTVTVNGKVEFYIPALSSTTIDVYTTNPNGAPGSVTGNNPADTGAVFYINLPLPAGNHVIIDTTVDASVDKTASGNATIFRNNNVTGNPYPFTIPNVISITSNSAYTASTPNSFQSFYYYMYNMQIQTSDCISDRAAVLASATALPIITLSGDNLVSSIDSGVQWYYNDSAIAGATNVTYTPHATGIYTVHTLNSAGCELVSAGYAFAIADGGISLSVTPNPNRGFFNVSFNAGTNTDFSIELFDVLGQKFISQSYSNFSGLFTGQFNAGNVVDGVYILSVRIGKKSYKKKLLITK